MGHQAPALLQGNRCCLNALWASDKGGNSWETLVVGPWAPFHAVFSTPWCLLVTKKIEQGAAYAGGSPHPDVPNDIKWSVRPVLAQNPHWTSERRLVSLSRNQTWWKLTICSIVLKGQHVMANLWTAPQTYNGNTSIHLKVGVPNTFIQVEKSLWGFCRSRPKETTNLSYDWTYTLTLKIKHVPTKIVMALHYLE